MTLVDQTTLVLLQRDRDVCRPIALGVPGSYDRYGCIDGTKQHPGNTLLVDFFRHAHAAGRFEVDVDSYPIGNVEQLINAIERHINEAPEPARLDGLPLTYAMICQPVWDALSDAYPSDGNYVRQFEKAFRGSLVPTEIYGGHLEVVADRIRDMAGVCDFLSARQIPWEASGIQPSVKRIRSTLREARSEFKNFRVIMEAMKEYELLISDLEC